MEARGIKHKISRRNSRGKSGKTSVGEALLQKEGAVQDSIVDVNYNTARKIQKEVENFYYDMITRRSPQKQQKNKQQP